MKHFNVCIEKINHNFQDFSAYYYTPYRRTSAGIRKRSAREEADRRRISEGIAMVLADLGNQANPFVRYNHSQRGHRRHFHNQTHHWGTRQYNYRQFR